MVPRGTLPVPSSSEILRQGSVLIKHPGRDKLLLRLPCFTQLDATDPAAKTRCGVSRRLVLNACRILTNHAASDQGDFLASDLEGQDKVPVEDPNPLDFHCYYFLGPPEVEAYRNYPIVKMFSAFRFPSSLPEDWCQSSSGMQSLSDDEPIVSSSGMSCYVHARDRRCAVTGYQDCALLHIICHNEPDAHPPDCGRSYVLRSPHSQDRGGLVHRERHVSPHRESHICTR